MLDLDPRDYDSRDEERHANTPSRGGRGSSGDHDRDHDWRQPDARTRDRDDGDERSLGRGPGNDRQGSDTEAVSVARPGKFLNVPKVGRLVKKLVRG